MSHIGLVHVVALVVLLYSTVDAVITSQKDCENIEADDLCYRTDICAYVLTSPRNDDDTCPEIFEISQKIDGVVESVDQMFTQLQETSQKADTAASQQADLLVIIAQQQANDEQQSQDIEDLKARMDNVEGIDRQDLVELSSKVDDLEQQHGQAISDLTARVVTLESELDPGALQLLQTKAAEFESALQQLTTDHQQELNDLQAQLQVQAAQIVELQNRAVEGEVRLADGATEFQGRVEIYHADQWGTVCDDDFDGVDALVICRQLGYSVGTPYQGGIFPQGQEPTWLDNVACNGGEHGLMQCGGNAWGDENCGHGEDAGVVCANDGYIRLVGGSTPRQGRVEIYHAAEWGTVCDDSFQAVDAGVVCRQLGFSGGTVRITSTYGQGAGKIWLDNVECLGTETGLGDCPNNGWEIHNCNHGEDVGVDCDP